MDAAATIRISISKDMGISTIVYNLGGIPMN